jgi:dihydroxyacetone kinase-like predicted kinase
MYKLEFILHIYNTPVNTLKSSLSEFGEDLEITDSCQDPDAKGKDFKINIKTEEPTLIFDVCSQFGRIKSAKVDEV